MSRTFKDTIKKVHAPRKHKITNSRGVYDVYKFIRKNKWYDIGTPVKEKLFYSIIRKVNQLLAEELVKGIEVKLPYGFGSLEVRKRPSRLSIVEGKLVTNLPVDWEATLNLWQEDEESYNKRTLVRSEEEDIYRVHYNKFRALFKNKEYFEFRPMRAVKIELKKAIKEGILDAYLVERYG